jgi:hypothetical protein
LRAQVSSLGATNIEGLERIRSFCSKSKIPLCAYFFGWAPPFFQRSPLWYEGPKTLAEMPSPQGTKATIELWRFIKSLC